MSRPIHVNPTLAQLETLLAEARSGGKLVDLEVEGERREICQCQRVANSITTNYNGRNEMSLKFMTQTSAVLLAGLALAGTATTSANAASSTATTYVGSSPAMCVKGEATQYPGNAGFASRWAPVSATPYLTDCSTPLQLPQGNVATKADIYKWTGSTWAYCTGTGWVYGGYTPGVWRGDIYYSPTYGASTSSYAGSCGAGYYGVNAAAYAYGSGRWNGGWVWSGYEYIS